jgi:AcrR family transcriptional regulator
LILDTARALAESEGWDAVTTRRLATEIEYSQPVLYKHFSSMEAIAEALALEGFSELAQSLCAARGKAEDGPLISMSTAYFAFAQANPALYDAMFVRTTGLSFAAADTPAPLVDAFAEMRAAVAAESGEHDADTRTEVFWATLHGLIMLDRGGRIRPGLDGERLDLLAENFRARPDVRKGS